MAINIWMVTWNCELMAPSNQTLQNSFLFEDLRKRVVLGDQSPPDLIVIAMQEANPAGNDGFIAKRVETYINKLNINNPTIGQYKVLGEEYFKGKTKGHCFTYMGVLLRQSSNQQNNANLSIGIQGTRIVGSNPGKSLSATRQFKISNLNQGRFKDSKLSKPSFIQTKGGIYFTIEVDTNDPDVIKNFGVRKQNNIRHFAFIGAHLDADNETDRNRQIKKLLKGVTEAAGIDNPADNTAKLSSQLNKAFDAVFFMGDLNYRLGKNGQITSSTTVVDNSTTTIGEFPMHKSISAIDMASIIANPTYRLGLLKKMDSLEESPLSKDFKFIFPIPMQPNGNDVAFPSYKLDYGNDIGRACFSRLGEVLKLITNTDWTFTFDRSSNSTIPNTYQKLDQGSQSKAESWKSIESLLEYCYFRENGSPTKIYDKDRKKYNLGWLDRIGYLASRPNAISVKQCEPYYILLSDHLPVILKVECR